MQKVLCVNMTIDPVLGGGTAHRTMAIARFMVDHGADCTVLATSHGYPDVSKYEQSGVNVVLLPVISNRFYLPRFSWRRLKELVAAADIVHVMSHWTFINIIIYFLVKSQRKKYTFCPAGSLHIFGRSRFFKQLYNLLVGYRIARDAEICIAVTEREKQDFLSYGVKGDAIVVIPNGIDEHVFYPDADAAADFRKRFGLGISPLILFSGRQNLIKGPDLLLLAFIRIASHYHDYQLVIMGPDGGLNADLIKMSQDAGIRHRVHFTGYLGGRDQLGAYCAADLLVVPSRREAMSIVAVEAGACGTPVLLTDSCGFDEVGDAGGVVVKSDVSGIECGLREMLDDRVKLAARGKKLRDMIIDRYTWKRTAQQYLEL